MKSISLVLVLAAAAACVWSDGVKVDREEVVMEERVGVAAGAAALAALVSAGELSIKIQDRYLELLSTLSGAEELNDRFRTLELVIANDSGYLLRFAGEYFDSGTWYSQPKTTIETGDAAIATVANGQAAPTGVTGGMSWEIVDTGKYLTIGFTNPSLGSFKTWIGVLDNADAKYGYDSTEDDSVKLLEENGFALVARIETSEIADKRFIFAIA